MGRKHKDEFSKGIYQRPGSQNYWLRYTVGKKQIRKSLGTADRAEAVVIAENILSGATEEATIAWDLSVEKYISRKLSEEDFTPKTAKTVRHALLCFQKYCNPTNPSDITTKSIKGFYETLRKKNNGLRREDNKLSKEPFSEATSQAYVTKVATFANAHKIIIDLPKFKGEAIGVRNVVSEEEFNRLIDEAPNEVLKAILHLGFCCGLRKDEIVNVRPHWIDLKTKRLTIPAKEGDWQSKSKRSRVVPIRQKTKEFLETHLDGWRGWKYLIEPKAKGKRYRYDFRRPFADYMKKQGYSWVTPHLMRHSYATFLAEKGVSPIMIASWTGDRIKTIERHYLHTHAASTDVIDEVFGDKESESTMQMNRLEKQMAQSISLIEALYEQQGKKITKSEALAELAKNPTFAPVVEDFSTQAMLNKMTDEQREEFLNSLPF